jgi:PIN domain nuclease of toxin-antitoxin system
LPAEVRRAVDDPSHPIAFSVASVWEVAIKSSLRRTSFAIDPGRLRRLLLDAELREFTITAEHAIAVRGLPPLHRDPFDRMLVAQAGVEDATLVTADRLLASYPGQVRLMT